MPFGRNLRVFRFLSTNGDQPLFRILLDSCFPLRNLSVFSYFGAKKYLGVTWSFGYRCIAVFLFWFDSYFYVPIGFTVHGYFQVSCLNRLVFDWTHLMLDMALRFHDRNVLITLRNVNHCPLVLLLKTKSF